MTAISRRHFIKDKSKLLLAAAVVPAAFMAGCATNPTTGAVTLDPNVVVVIQNAVATAAKYIPTLDSIALAAASLFGPAYVAVVQFGTTAVNTVINALVGVVTNLSPPASAKMRATLRAAAPGSPVLIGRLPNGAPVFGYPVK